VWFKSWGENDNVFKRLAETHSRACNDTKNTPDNNDKPTTAIIITNQETIPIGTKRKVFDQYKDIQIQRRSSKRKKERRE